MNGKVLEVDRLHTNQRRNIIIGSEGQTVASTLSHDKASNTVEKQSHQFSYTKDYTLQVAYLVKTAIRMSELDADCESGEKNLTKPLKTNATAGWLTYDTESMKRTNTYGNRSTVLKGE